MHVLILQSLRVAQYSVVERFERPTYLIMHVANDKTCLIYLFEDNASKYFEEVYFCIRLVILPNSILGIVIRIPLLRSMFPARPYRLYVYLFRLSIVLYLVILLVQHEFHTCFFHPTRHLSQCLYVRKWESQQNNLFTSTSVRIAYCSFSHTIGTSTLCHWTS